MGSRMLLEHLLDDDDIVLTASSMPNEVKLCNVVVLYACAGSSQWRVM